MHEKTHLESRLLILVAKMQAAQKQSHLDFDWQMPAQIPFWLSKRLASAAVNHLHQGEVATARMCRQIRNQIENETARTFLDLQRQDECRHARIYRSYFEKIGGTDPKPNEVQKLYEKALSWRGAPEAIILAFHVVLEGEFLQLQREVDRWLPCPLFKQISAVIARDEARHVAFGKTYLKASLPHLPLQERQQIYGWLKELWSVGIRSAMQQFAPPGFISLSNRLGHWMDKEWLERLDELEAAGLFIPDEKPMFEAT